MAFLFAAVTSLAVTLAFPPLVSLAKRLCFRLGVIESSSSPKGGLISLFTISETQISLKCSSEGFSLVERVFNQNI
jgi:hypothetical protein